MDFLKKKAEKRRVRKRRIRKKISGKPERPRLCVRRSLKNIYAQIVDDVSARSLVQVSSLSKEYLGQVEGVSGKIDMGTLVGNIIAEKAFKIGIKKVVFDKGGYKYHGRVKAVADGAREKGMEF